MIALSVEQPKHKYTCHKCGKGMSVAYMRGLAELCKECNFKKDKRTYLNG